MRNPLQDQLLKAGLVKKSQVAQVARPFAPPPGPSDPLPEPSRFAPPVRDPLFPADDGVVRRLGRIEARLSAIESKLEESLRTAPR